jgi:hypothetical protein
VVEVEAEAVEKAGALKGVGRNAEGANIEAGGRADVVAVVEVEAAAVEERSAREREGGGEAERGRGGTTADVVAAAVAEREVLSCDEGVGREAGAEGNGGAESGGCKSACDRAGSERVPTVAAAVGMAEAGGKGAECSRGCAL